MARRARRGGSRKGLKIAPDRGDPLAAVLRFGRRATRTGLIVGFLVATLSHGAFAGRALAAPVHMRMWAEQAQKDIHDFLWANYDIEIVKPPPPAPEPEEEKKEEPEEEKPAPTPVREPSSEPPPPPPPAAQAGKVLTAPEQPDEPLDLTGDGFVTGDGDTYVGGVTAAAGTGTTATYNPAASPTGKPGGTGTATKVAPPPPKPTGPDRSRSATISAGTNWSSCPFPSEADVDQVDFAVVTLLVTVRPDGTPRSVQVLSDPGHGFGRAARLCALSKRYTSALDREGNPTIGTTPPIRVTFTR